MLKSMTDFWRILDKKAWKFLVLGNWLWHLMNDFRIQHICWNIWKVIALAQFLFCNCGFCIEIYSVFILNVLLGMMCVWCALFWFLLLTLHICSVPACLLASLFVQSRWTKCWCHWIPLICFRNKCFQPQEHLPSGKLT